jgi:hypothetical protein
VTSPYPEFRRKLDAVLRQRDPQALRAFLIAEGQWEESAATDPERAMWMMIATSPALAALRGEAIGWLAGHGYAEEARALGGTPGGAQDAGRPARQPPAGGRSRGSVPGRPPAGQKGHQPGPGGSPRRPPDRGGAHRPKRP